MMKARHPAVVELFALRGSVKAVAAACGIRSQAVSWWRAVPNRHAKTVAAVLGRDTASIPTRACLRLLQAATAEGVDTHT